MDGEALLRAMASGQMDKVASALPPEFKNEVDKLNKLSDTGDVSGILEMARKALDRTVQILKEEETKK